MLAGVRVKLLLGYQLGLTLSLYLVEIVIGTKESGSEQYMTEVGSDQHATELV